MTLLIILRIISKKKTLSDNMSADSFNTTSTKIVTNLIAGTVAGQFQWNVVNDEKHILQCRTEIGATARIEGKIFYIKIFDYYLRVFKYRNYVSIMTKDKMQILTQDGSVLIVPEGGSEYVLEFYEPIDFSTRVRLNPTNSISDLYDTVLKHVFSVDDFLKDLEKDSKS